jgi:hypothetical protein
MTPDWEKAAWRKSSRSGGSGGQCVELATTCGFTAVRDSKNPNGPIIVFADGAFGPFLANVKASQQ